MAEDCENKKKERLRHLAREQAFELQLIKTSYAPHHLALQGASPRGEALTQGKASHFCRRKFCEQNFMQARGSREAADNFCRKK